MAGTEGADTALNGRSRECEMHGGRVERGVRASACVRADGAGLLGVGLHGGLG